LCGIYCSLTVMGQHDSLRLKSTEYLKTGNSIQALRFALEWISHIDSTDYGQLAAANEQIGDIYASEKIYGAAINYYAQTLELQSAASSMPLLSKLGDAYFENHQLDSAAVYYERIYALHEKRNDYEGRLHSWQQLAKVYKQKGDCDKALEYYYLISGLIEANNDSRKQPLVENNIAYQYHCLGDYKLAIEHFKKALSYCQDDCPLDLETLYTNLGIALFNHNEFEPSISFLSKALTIAEKKNNRKTIAQIRNMIAKSHFEYKELFEALQSNNIAITTAKAAQENNLLKDIYLTQANIYERLYEYDKALDYYQLHLQLRDSLLLEERVRQEQFLQHQFSLEQSEQEIKLLLVNKKVQDLAFEQLRLEKDNLALAAEKRKQELDLLRKEQLIRDEKIKYESLQALKAKQELSLTRQRLAAAAKDKEILSLREKETQQALDLAQKEAIQQEREKEILALNNEKKVQAIELEKQAAFRRFSSYILGALSIIVLLVLFGYYFARKTNRKLTLQKGQIEDANAKNEELLLNILPEETARELKKNGVAQPRYYENVSVLFADFENFTSLSEKMTPSELIKELNACFVAFDTITSRYGLEKIKTIGDAYMCAGGIPTPNNTHADDAVAAAKEMMDFIRKRRREKEKQGIKYWNMRIGIHTGSVVAGVVGSKKFAYDIWGDSVNIAARMESHSLPGRINISKSTLEQLTTNTPVENRGVLPVKNRGAMEMFFIKL